MGYFGGRGGIWGGNSDWDRARVGIEVGSCGGD